LADDDDDRRPPPRPDRRVPSGMLQDAAFVHLSDMAMASERSCYHAATIPPHMRNTREERPQALITDFR